MWQIFHRLCQPQGTSAVTQWKVFQMQTLWKAIRSGWSSEETRKKNTLRATKPKYLTYMRVSQQGKNQQLNVFVQFLSVLDVKQLKGQLGPPVSDEKMNTFSSCAIKVSWELHNCKYEPQEP